MKGQWYSWLCMAAIMVLGGCKQVAMVEQQTNIPGGQWQRSFVPEYNFNITDTSRDYRLYVVLRHTNRYEYRNIWLNVGIQYPQDSLHVQQFELPLAGADKWLGTGIDDVFERRVLLLPKPVRFHKTGTIRFTLQHTMRVDPLPHILQAGLRVEPVPAAN